MPGQSTIHSSSKTDQQAASRKENKLK
ncbi:hypothetical protein CCACVL1_23564 [Corchorus capsularis]|uniref:Uncharacterized protein n=1 Tax=Corchorus capsularis TaxID=210143 RepID=A0A1R3GTG9_COCAP|nr:hypothetical protein CCACVL1_23564 [Corchorus capsularis]